MSRAMIDAIEKTINQHYHLPREGRDWFLSDDVKLRTPGRNSLGFSLDDERKPPFVFFGGSPPAHMAKMCDAIHKKPNGTDTEFEFHQESEGSRRVIDLLPAFLRETPFGLNRVYVIDELNRSLHPLLTRKLIEAYLASCDAQSRAQLLFTTHDVSLMDQQMFRRDEIWATEKNSEGNSTLFPFSDYKDIRYDKDIRKSYLQGRLGGVPRFFLIGTEVAEDKK